MYFWPFRPSELRHKVERELTEAWGPKNISLAIRRLPLLSALIARADVTLLIEEPYGAFGGMTPTGHATIYLSRVCAETPLSLRRCNPGEQGVVISRYHRIEGFRQTCLRLSTFINRMD
jgi:hypothetical protein